MSRENKTASANGAEARTPIWQSDFLTMALLATVVVAFLVDFQQFAARSGGDMTAASYVSERLGQSRQ